MADPDPIDDLKKQLADLAKRFAGIEGLLPDLMAEVKLLHAENGAILKGLEGDGVLAQRIGCRVTVQEVDRLVLLGLAEVSFITTHPDDTLAVYTDDGSCYTNFESLDVIGQRFATDPRLMRTHKSYLVNLARVRTVDNVGGGRLLTFLGCPDTLQAKVSEDNHADFERRLGIEHA